MSHLRDLISVEKAHSVPLPAWLDRLVSAGIVDRDPKVVRRQKLVNVAAMAGAFNSGSRVVSGFFYQADDVFLLQAVSAAFFLAACFIHRLHRLGENAGAIGLVAWFLGSTGVASFMFGLQAQVQSYFVLGGVAWFLFGLENWRLAGAALFAVLATTLAVMTYVPLGGVVVPFLSPASGLLAIQSLINAIAINAVVLFYSLFLLQRAETELERQSRRAETLVSVVLPNAVAARLRAEPDRRIADRLDGVCILFADLAGFTEAAHHETPEAVVAYLDEHVRLFDLACERLAVEKIKTIGDAYMAASGLNGDTRTGAVAIGRLALAMMELHDACPALGDRRLALRVGIHCGSAIAGVIGDMRISYDLWGDAVNMASRLETQGEAGRIHVSEAFRAVAGNAFSFEERGPTEIRGIGSVRTYFLTAGAVP